MVDLSKVKETYQHLDDIVTSTNNSMTHYATTNDYGTFIGFGLYNDGDVAVQRVFMSRGTEVPEHAHEEDEYVIIYKGTFEFAAKNGGATCKGKYGKLVGDTIVLKEKDHIYIPSNVLHGGKMLEDTWIISVTIPAAAGYP